jgi:hypothetical protein
MEEARILSRSTRLAIAIACLLMVTAAAYFFVYPEADRARPTTDVWSNVQHVAQPDLPVHVLTPPSIGGFAVPQLQNSTAKPFALRVAVRRPGSGQQHEWKIELQPKQTLSLARQGGWAFARGDELELVQDGFRPRKVQLQ